MKLSRSGRDETMLKLSLNIESRKAVRSDEIVGDDAADVILVRSSLRSCDLDCWLEFDSMDAKADATSDDAISAHPDPRTGKRTFADSSAVQFRSRRLLSGCFQAP